MLRDAVDSAKEQRDVPGQFGFSEQAKGTLESAKKAKQPCQVQTGRVLGQRRGSSRVCEVPREGDIWEPSHSGLGDQEGDNIAGFQRELS